MSSFDYILILQAVLAIILALTLCFTIWRLAKAGGSVEVGGHVIVNWGQKEGASDGSL